MKTVILVKADKACTEDTHISNNETTLTLTINVFSLNMKTVSSKNSVNIRACLVARVRKQYAS